MVTNNITTLQSRSVSISVVVGEVIVSVGTETGCLEIWTIPDLGSDPACTPIVPKNFLNVPHILFHIDYMKILERRPHIHIHASRSKGVGEDDWYFIMLASCRANDGIQIFDQ